MVVVGQSLECWRAPLLDAVSDRNPGPLVERARRQMRAGAAALDVNLGTTGTAEVLTWAAQVVRTQFPGVPIFLDCGDLAAIRRATETTRGPIVVNAVPLEERLSEDARSLVEVPARMGAGIVFSPRAADLREDDGAILEAAELVQDLVARAGITGPAYLDCLTYPPATNPVGCRRSLRWARALRESKAAGVQPLTVPGLRLASASRARTVLQRS